MSKKNPWRSSTGSCKLLREAEGLYFDFQHPRTAPTLPSEAGTQACPPRSNGSLNQINIPRRFTSGVAKMTTWPSSMFRDCGLLPTTAGLCYPVQRHPSPSGAWKRQRAPSHPLSSPLC